MSCVRGAKWLSSAPRAASSAAAARASARAAERLQEKLMMGPFRNVGGRGRRRCSTPSSRCSQTSRCWWSRTRRMQWRWTRWAPRTAPCCTRWQRRLRARAVRARGLAMVSGRAEAAGRGRGAGRPACARAPAASGQPPARALWQALPSSESLTHAGVFMQGKDLFCRWISG